MAIKKLVMFVAGYLICSAAVLFFYTVQHETAHHLIQQNFGCRNSTIHLNFGGLLGGYAQCDATDMNDEDYRFMNLANSINETWGYQNQVWLVGFLVLLFVFGLRGLDF